MNLACTGLGCKSLVYTSLSQGFEPTAQQQPTSGRSHQDSLAYLKPYLSMHQDMIQEGACSDVQSLPFRSTK